MKQAVAWWQSFFFFFSLNTFYFYYKYSSVVTKRSICHEDTAKQKECSAHKTGFIHNNVEWNARYSWFREWESPSETLPFNLSSLHPWKTETGSEVKAIGQCLQQDTSDWFTQTPFPESPLFRHPVTFPYIHHFSFFILFSLFLF